MQPPATLKSPLKPNEAAQRRVVLIGASVRSAAQSARRAGFHPTGIDLFGDVETLAACEHYYPLDRQLAVKFTNRELPIPQEDVPSLQVGGLNADSDLVNQLTQFFPPLNQTCRLMEHDLDPHWLFRVAKKSGLHFPETQKRIDGVTMRSHEECSQSDAKSPLQADPTGRWLRKQAASSGGLGVQWLSRTPTHQAEAMRKATQATPPPSQTAATATHSRKSAVGNQVWIQRWIGGRSIGATFLSNGKECRLLGVCRSLFTRKSERPFVYRGSMGPIPINSTLEQQLRTLGHVITEESSFRGLLNADLVIDRNQNPWLLEVNPRWSGSSELIEFAMRRQGLTNSLFSCLVEACEGHSIDQYAMNLEPPVAPSIKRILYARETVQFDLRRLPDDLNGRIQIHDFPVNGTLIERGEPICTLRSDSQSDERTTNHRSPKKSPMWKHRALVDRVMKAITQPVKVGS